MPTVHRAGNLRFVVFLDDHGPPHVHVFATGGEAKLLLGTPDGRPSLVALAGLGARVGSRESETGDARDAGATRQAVRRVASRSRPGERRAAERMRPPWRENGRRPRWTARSIAPWHAAGGARSSEPRATRARYDRRTGRVVVDLTNGCSFVFPARSLQGLAQAREAELADIEILGSGHGYHWPALDTDFTVPGLLMGVFGARAWMASELARHAGQASRRPRPAAARTNGRKGGRPAAQSGVRRATSGLSPSSRPEPRRGGVEGPFIPALRA